MLRVVEVEGVTLAFKILNDASLVGNRLQDHGVRDELVGDHCYFLVDTAIGPQYRAAAKIKMVCEVMVVFNLVAP